MGRQGVRSEWRDVPPAVRQRVDELLGSAVVGTTAVQGGFSPGPAVRADLADGRAVFLKAAGLDLNADAPRMHRAEGSVLGRLPRSVPAPPLIGVVDDGDWVVLAIRWIDGRMPVAGDADDVARLLGVLHRVAAATAGLRVPGLDAFATTHRDVLGQWVLLAADPPAALDEWSRRHLDVLAALDAVAPEATAGSRPGARGRAHRQRAAGGRRARRRRARGLAGRRARRAVDRPGRTAARPPPGRRPSTRPRS